MVEFFCATLLFGDFIPLVGNIFVFTLSIRKGLLKLTSPHSPHSSHGTGAVEDYLWYLASLHSCALNIDAYYMALSVMRRKWQNA